MNDVNPTILTFKTKKNEFTSVSQKTKAPTHVHWITLSKYTHLPRHAIAVSYSCTILDGLQSNDLFSHSLGSPGNFPTESSEESVLLQLVWMKNKNVQWAWFPILKPQKKWFCCTRPTCLQWENVWSLSPILNTSFEPPFQCFQCFQASVGLLSQTFFSDPRHK